MPGILVGLDGSDHSRLALERAIDEAGIRHLPLTVITVHQISAGSWGAPVVYPGDLAHVKQAREVAQTETDNALRKTDPESQPASVAIEAVSGLPAEQLLKAAADSGASMIVVGSRGAGGFQRLLLGSVSSQITHHAHCPVVVIPAGNA